MEVRIRKAGSNCHTISSELPCSYRACEPTAIATKPYWLAATLVTQESTSGWLAQPLAIFVPRAAEKQIAGQETKHFPVEFVSWEDAVEFCRKLSELPGEKAARRRYGFAHGGAVEMPAVRGTRAGGPSAPSPILLGGGGGEAAGRVRLVRREQRSSDAPCGTEAGQRLGAVRHAWQRVAVVPRLV